MLLAEYRELVPSGMEYLEKDLEECVTPLLFPGEHRKRIRTTNLLERTFEESQRRTKVIPASRESERVSRWSSPRSSPLPGGDTASG